MRIIVALCLGSLMFSCTDVQENDESSGSPVDDGVAVSDSDVADLEDVTDFVDREGTRVGAVDDQFGGILATGGEVPGVIYSHVACEDECDECGTLHCPSELHYLCLDAAQGHPPTCGVGTFENRPLACVCCAENECLEGTHSTGSCVPCEDPQQVCHNDRNECCTKLSQSAACGTGPGAKCAGTAPDGCGRTLSCVGNNCSAGLTCYNGICCTPLTKAQACGTWKCGTASNGCGGTISCGTCPTHSYCSSYHTCLCSAPYHGCPIGPPCILGPCP